MALEVTVLATSPGCRIATGLSLLVLVSAFAVPATAQNSQSVSSPKPGQPGFKAPVITDTAALPGLRQPIFFRHDIHAGQDRIPCMYCHYTGTVSSEPGIPPLQTCIGCHQLIGGSTPSHQAEIKKVRQAWSDKQPPQWIRIHVNPGFVRFAHMRHLKILGTDAAACANCHGEVAGMTQVYQVKTLRMGWCISCHIERKVSRDCSVCHY